MARRACHNPGHGDDASVTVYTDLLNVRSVIRDASGTFPLTPDYQCGTEPNAVRLADASSGNADHGTSSF